MKGDIIMANLNSIPPHSLESEQCIIGSILMDSESLISAMDVISSDDFYSTAHKLIYETILELHSESKYIDIITVSDKLKSKGYLDEIGGINYLSSTTTIVPTTSNIRAYAEIVREKSTLRKLIRMSNEIIDLGYNEDIEIDDILNQAEKKIFDISQNNTNTNFKFIGNVLTDVYSKIEEVYSSNSDITGIDTGFTDLNKKLGGFHNSDLILIAARPGMGKTAFALNLVLNAALKSDANVAVFSLEMSREQLVQRLVSAQSNVPLKHISNGNIADDEWKKLMDGMKILSQTNIFIDDTPGIKASEIRSKCRKLKIEKGLDMIMIDYLQLMEGEGRSENRQQEVSKISRALKILAKEMNCPVIALSQLSRSVENGKDKEPKLSDLRDSGAIEQDADIVMFIYRDEYYNKTSEKKNIAEIKIAKNRHGELSDIELIWVGHVQKFLNKVKHINEDYNNQNQ